MDLPVKPLLVCQSGRLFDDKQLRLAGCLQPEGGLSSRSPPFHPQLRLEQKHFYQWASLPMSPLICHPLTEKSEKKVNCLIGGMLESPPVPSPTLAALLPLTGEL